MHGICVWWRQPDHYDWLSSYLKARGLLVVTRFMLFVLLATIATATALTLASPSGPREPVQRTVGLVVIAVLGGIALWYLFGWPTRLQSQIFSVAGNACIAAGVLSEADPRTAMVGCAAFAGLAGYVAFFHTAPYLVLTLVTALVTAAATAMRIAVAGDPAMALSKLLILCGGMLAVPVSGQILVHWLSIDSLNSATDALTGLRNRRGFYRSAQELLSEKVSDEAQCFTAVMVDLDDFKRLNDTLGHATGDRILVAVADSLRAACRETTVIARVGGEEFLVAQISSVEEAHDTAERIRLAIASIPWGVTASLGLACSEIRPTSPNPQVLLERLVEAADAAMYEAKRAGGNRIRHAEHNAW